MMVREYVTHFVVLVDFFNNKDGVSRVMLGAEFFDEVERTTKQYLKKRKKDGSQRKDTGAWTFNPKWSAELFQKAKGNWEVIEDYLRGGQTDLIH